MTEYGKQRRVYIISLTIAVLWLGVAIFFTWRRQGTFITIFPVFILLMVAGAARKRMNAAKENKGAGNHR